MHLIQSLVLAWRGHWLTSITLLLVLHEQRGPLLVQPSTAQFVPSSNRPPIHSYSGSSLKLNAKSPQSQFNRYQTSTTLMGP